MKFRFCNSYMVWLSTALLQNGNVYSQAVDSNGPVSKRLASAAKESVMVTILRLLFGVVVSMYIGACRQQKLKTFSIVSGSENKSLETLIKDLGRQNGLDIKMTYLGSVDIAREMKKGQGGHTMRSGPHRRCGLRWAIPNTWLNTAKALCDLRWCSLSKSPSQ